MLGENFIPTANPQNLTDEKTLNISSFIRFSIKTIDSN